MIYVHTTIPFDPERIDDAKDLVADLAERSRDEPGTVRYRAMTDLDDDSTIRFFEQYEDEAAWRAHTETDHYRRFVDRLPDLVDGSMESINVLTDGRPEVHEFGVDDL
ncbi:putative quinol monooxygenase [Halostella salina]|uniref:putative quinol monooxygenase n=1 Tax=Halostella salina TaxID=1547897 RepID=UPI000EF82F6D|nr:putative quinol monooxygenase [Halostella salina]